MTDVYSFVRYVINRSSIGMPSIFRQVKILPGNCKRNLFPTEICQRFLRLQGHRFSDLTQQVMCLLLKQMKCLVFTILLLACGCTTVVVKTPMGEYLADEDAQTLVGEWLAPKQLKYRVDYDETTKRFTALHEKDNEWVRSYFTIREINGVHIVWYEDANGYIPLRITASNSKEVDFITLLFPDAGEIKSLVDNGKLSGRHYQEKRLLELDTEGLDAHLATKGFWVIDMNFPFMKMPQALQAENDAH